MNSGGGKGGWQAPRPLQGKFSPAPPLKQSLRKKIPLVTLLNLAPLIFFSYSAPACEHAYNVF